MIEQVNDPHDFYQLTYRLQLADPIGTNQIASHVQAARSSNDISGSWWICTEGNEVISMACLIDDEVILSPTITLVHAHELGHRIGLGNSIVTEVRGQVQVLGAFIDGYRKNHPQVIEKWKRTSLIYELGSLHIPNHIPGKLVVPTLVTKELLEWSKEFCMESNIPIEYSDRIVTRGIQRELLHTWQVNGTNVAFASFALPVMLQDSKIIRITSVFTAKEYRRKGYASGLLGALCTKVLNGKSTRVMLNVSSDNEPAKSAYQRIGFHYVLSTTTFTIE